MKKGLLSIAGLIFMATLLIGADIDLNWKLLKLEDWSRGMNTSMVASKIPYGSALRAENVYIDENEGAFTTRPGYILAGSTSTLSKVTFMMEFVNDDGSRKLIVSDSSRVLITQDFVTYTLLKTTLTTTAILRGAQGRNKALICNGADPCFYTDGTNAYDLNGTNGFPNVPRGKYPAYYQEQFWVYNTTANNSALTFSGLTSTDGFKIDPLTDNRAWPIVNQLNVGLGDGHAGSGLDVYRGQLRAHKDNSSIYTIFGIDIFSYIAVKTNAYIGTVSQDSISQWDNYEYYLGRDGVYQFNGTDAIRISDDILPDIQSIINNLSNIQANKWDSKDDFDRLGTYQGSTSTANGFVTLYSSPFYANYISASSPTGSDYITLNSSLGSGTTGTIFTVRIPSETLPSNFVGNVNNVIIWTRTRGGSEDVRITLRNEATGAVEKATRGDFDGIGCSGNPGSINGDWVKSVFGKPIDVGQPAFSNSTGPLRITGGQLATSSLTVMVEIDNCGSSTFFDFFAATTTGYAQILLDPDTTGQYISEVSTITTVTFWDTFNSNFNTNGGNANFYIKGATSVVNITTEAWTSITPGAVIGLPTAKRFIQWSTTMTGTALSIDNVTINHNEGSANDSRPMSVINKNHYWLVVTTEIGSNRRAIYVKSKITTSYPNAWVLWTGIDLGAITRYNNLPYGGSSTNGNFYRLDYGTNDNGSIISWIYDTPEIIFEEPFFEKGLHEIMYEAQAVNGATLNIGYQINSGTFTTQSVTLPVGTRKLGSLYNVQAQKMKYAKFRFSGSELDKPVAFHRMGTLYDIRKSR